MAVAEDGLGAARVKAKDLVVVAAVVIRRPVAVDALPPSGVGELLMAVPES